MFSGRMESPITPTSLGELTRLIGFTLKGAEPGDYEMVLTFRDELSGQSFESREKFTVVPAPPPSAPAATDEGKARAATVGR
jgi:hypothetical protein